MRCISIDPVDKRLCCAMRHKLAWNVFTLCFDGIPTKWLTFWACYFWRSSGSLHACRASICRSLPLPTWQSSTGTAWLQSPLSLASSSSTSPFTSCKSRQGRATRASPSHLRHKLASLQMWAAWTHTRMLLHACKHRQVLWKLRPCPVCVCAVCLFAWVLSWPQIHTQPHLAGLIPWTAWQCMCMYQAVYVCASIRVSTHTCTHTLTHTSNVCTLWPLKVYAHAVARQVDIDKAGHLACSLDHASGCLTCRLDLTLMTLAGTDRTNSLQMTWFTRALWSMKMGRLFHLLLKAGWVQCVRKSAWKSIFFCHAVMSWEQAESVFCACAILRGCNLVLENPVLVTRSSFVWLVTRVLFCLFAQCKSAQALQQALGSL